MNSEQKKRKVGYHYTLKSPQYENCEVLGPDGNLMFRCCKKKANWYLQKNLGTKLKDQPLTVQLTFIPKGVGHVDDPYFLQIMHNRCVVCGSEDSLTRHHIVPYCYRKFFPTHLKQHRSYDVMALCIPCHHEYERHALEFKQNLAVKYSAPVSGVGTKYDRNLAIAKGAAQTLLNNNDKIPELRKQELQQKVRDYLKQEPTEKNLKELTEKDAYDFGNFVHHGKIVIGQIENIEEFVQNWRTHFLNKMNPKFLPSHWTVYRPIDYK